jgi:DNA invertase Pin-like site-specific DNA recombinase
VYTNRPFGKVFQAIRDVQKYLEPVFQEAGPSPFSPQSQAYTKRSVIERIIELHEQSVPTEEIAATVDVSVQTVIRHVQKNRPQHS